MTATEDPAAACPVDHKTREVWLKQSQKQKASDTPTPAPTPTPTPTPTPSPLKSEGCDSSAIQQSSPSPSAARPSILASLGLGTDREVSTIPRTTTAPADPNARPANSEKDTGKDEKTGNWIYPSEEMFFNAMKRKGFEGRENDMKTIVPIHNAVNERAWKEIKDWEKGREGDRCGGPKLASFSGLSTSLTPRARWKTLLGYTAPFDRHDWVVDRCGTKIEYVIDFYAGKDEGKAGKSLNFYLDVRPKLNSFEGVKMRVMRYWGF